jgi:hypothetical protein
MLQVLHLNVAKVDQDVAHVAYFAVFQMNVASIYPKCVICFKCMLRVFLSIDVAYVYVPNVSSVSVLCCNKCFHVIS